MKKWIALLLCLAMVLGMTACGGNTAEAPTEAPTQPAETQAPTTEAPVQPVEIIVFAAASMTETLTKIKIFSTAFAIGSFDYICPGMVNF